ncbi:anti-sigma factor domain-containing protein [Clostridium paraputrificum]|uniref:anti-sigma factor domain-containing protein n=1 Tax=Clostridium TaxID=1485 RepID=UPI003D333671
MGEFQKNRYIFSSTPAILDVSENARRLREKQISIMVKELFLYKILLKDLVGHFPNYKDRNLILNIAYYIKDDVDIFDRIQKRRELPIAFIARKTKISRAFLEIWQDYIITYVLILSNPNYKYIQDYLRVEFKDNTNEITQPRSNTGDIYRGIVLKANRRSTIILTSAGEFIKVKSNDTEVGKELEAGEKKGIRHYKLQIAIAAVLIIFTAFGVYKEYTKVVRTVVIQTSSQVKLELNRFNKVIYSNSPSEKGRDMLNYAEPMDEDIDKVLKKCVEYAKKNDMVPQDGIVVTINGEALKYGILKETGDYIVEENIKVLINNVGQQHKLYESTEKQKEDKNEEKSKQ